MENLDDITSGVRVTRSLRKRLGSVESDASSRPGTPIINKLSSTSDVTKSDSPLRKSRRNSTAETFTPAKTPSKSTALKRIDTPDANNSSIRRVTRRRSISISEDDQSLQTQKLPKLKFDPLVEEDSTQLPKKNFQDSAPKSPLEPTKDGIPNDGSPKLFSNPEEKFQTKIVNFGSSDGIISDVEVVDLDSYDGSDPERKTINKSKQNILQQVDDSESSLDTTTKTLGKPTEKAADSSSKLAKITEESEPSSKEINEEGINSELNKGNNNSLNLISDQNVLETVNVSISKKNKSVDNINKEKETHLTVRVKRLSVSDVPSVDDKNDSLIKSASHSVVDGKKNELENLKVVAFNESGNEDESKITYPKTPALTKSKSYINEEPSKDEKKKLSFQEESQSIQSNSGKQSEIDADDAQTAVVEENHSNREILPVTTPYNPKFGGEFKSSTPIVFPKRKSIGSDSPKLNSSITNSKSKHNNIEYDEKTPKKDELSPDKLLRSGKIYGNSPPINTISDTPQKKSSTTPVLEEHSSENNNVPLKSVKEKPQEIENGTAANDAPMDKENNKSHTPFVTSWSNSVSAKADENTKIDVIEKDKNISHDTVRKSTEKENKHSRYESDDNEGDVATNDGDDDIKTEEDDEEMPELAEGENPFRKHPFVVDDAMEVDDDYESGDSLGSEERDEIVENEIRDDGESIGSEDTEEANGTDVDDIDDEYDSFIENDSEVSLLNYSDDDEHVEKKETVQRGKGNYKRILTVASSDSEENESEITTSGTINKEGHPLAFEITKMIDDDDSILDDQDNLEQTEVTTVSAQESASKELNVKKHDIKTLPPVDDNVNTLNDSPKSHVKKSPDLKQAINSNEIVNKSEQNNISVSNKSLIEHNNEESHKKHQDSVELDSPTLGKVEDTNQISNKKGKKSRKSLNKSNQEVTCLSTSSTEYHDVNDKDQVNTYMQSLNQSKDSGPNTSKLSDSARQLFERNDFTNTSGSDRGLENDIDQQNLSATRKQIIGNLNQSDHLNKTLHEPSTDKHESSPQTTEIEINEDIRQNSGRASLNESNSDKSLLSSNSTSFEKLICDTSNSTNTDNESDDRNRKEEKKSSKRLNAEDNVNGSTGKNILTYETESDEELHNQSLPTSTKARKKIKTQKTSTSLTCFLGAASTDESTAELEKCLVQQKPAENKRMSVSFKHSRQEEAETRKSLDVSLKYMEKNREEKIQSAVKDIVDENKSVSSSSPTPNTKPDFSDVDMEELNTLTLLKSIQKDLEKSSRRQSLGNPLGRSEQLLSHKSNRKSICLGDSNIGNNPSTSFLEKVAAERKQIVENQSKKRKRHSKSFTLGGSLDTDVGDQNHHLNKKSKISKTEHLNSSTPKEKKNENDNIQYILGRCEEILEAANRAKLEAKQNNNKNKVRKPKMFKAKISPEARDNVVESQSQTEQNEKQIKFNDDRKKSQINQAIKAATDLLLEKPTKNFIADCQLSPRSLEPKHLPSNEVNSFSDLKPSEIKNKTEDFISNLGKAGEKHAHVYQTSAGVVVETPFQKELNKKISKIELSTGTVLVEPVTPTKKHSLSGFQESPMTPRTFKVRKLLTAGQDTPPKMASETKQKKRERSQYKYDEPKNPLSKPQWTQSGVFIEEDLTSRPIKHSAKRNQYKHEELKNTLPKPQWTQSGAFIEEDLTSRPLKHIGSTQFFVSVLNKAGKVKKLTENANAPFNIANSNALQFKQNYLFRDNIPRESSSEILQRKKRKRHC